MALFPKWEKIPTVIAKISHIKKEIMFPRAWGLNSIFQSQSENPTFL